MKVGLICCGRLENRYAPEFVKYYKQLGFDNIHILDNNHDDEEHFEDILQSYIDEGFVKIHNFRNLEYLQLFGYAELWKQIYKDYDWIFMCDFDEYLVLKEDENVKSYLSRDCFKNYNQILINWIYYSDNNLVYDDGRPCIERFTTKSNYNGWETGLNKPFIRTISDEIKIEDTVHHVIDSNNIYENSSCNNCGLKVELHKSGCINPTFELAYIKHFRTKTIEEFITNKLKRGTADGLSTNFAKNTNIFDFFFAYNEETEEKINYLKSKQIYKSNC